MESKLKEIGQHIKHKTNITHELLHGKYEDKAEHNLNGNSFQKKTVNKILGK